jgi:hypothetical protein
MNRPMHPPSKFDSTSVGKTKNLFFPSLRGFDSLGNGRGINHQIPDRSTEGTSRNVRRLFLISSLIHCSVISTGNTAGLLEYLCAEFRLVTAVPSSTAHRSELERRRGTFSNLCPRDGEILLGWNNSWTKFFTDVKTSFSANESDDNTDNK